MKILHLGYSDKLGGASIAMMRLHRALKKSGVISNVLVGEKLTDDPNVIGPSSNLEKSFNELKIKIARQKKLIYSHDGKYSHSLNIFRSNVLSKIHKINPDIINLHWINNELISIKEISKIKIPVVWTFNDMWPMCGGEHYSDNNRFILGYNLSKMQKNESGFDINRYIWRKKKKYWKKNIKEVVCISNWLRKKTLQSDLFKQFKVNFIPCTIDKSEWYPIDKKKSREMLNIPLNKKVLLFMSTNGFKDFRKGFKYVKKSLENFLVGDNEILLLNIGNYNDIKIPGKNVININKTFNGESEKLKFYYSASDILLTPSVLEAFGQVAIEAASCGTPSIGFENTGLEDAILHKKTGYLAKFNDQDDFNNGLKWILDNISTNKSYFSSNCVKFTNNNFSNEIISNKYINLYKKVLNEI